MTSEGIRRWENAARVGAAVVTVVALLRIAETYGVFTGTYDEPLHVAAGMAWLQNRGGEYGVEHPPLGQMAVALGPYLRGIRPRADTDARDAGNSVLNEGGNYFSNLALARLGVLPFLVLMCGVTYLWGRQWFGPLTGFWAVVLLTGLPPILGHAGLATLDVACAATVLTALYCGVRWAESPSWPRALALGVATGVAFATKFSSILFLPVCAVTGGIVFGALWRTPATSRGRLRQAGTVVAVAFLVCWGAYRFSVEPLTTESNRASVLDRLPATSPARRALTQDALSVPVPLSEVIRGAYALHAENAGVETNYLFGHVNPAGFWMFFPVAIGVKTPIGFLLLAAAGLIIALAGIRKRTWQQGTAAVFALSILGVCMASRINQGVRHVLAIYPLLAVLGGQVIAAAASSSRRWTLALLPIACALWLTFDSFRAAPDYLAYFNQIAGSHPERILAESDLDWGQDLHRLSRRLRELNAPSVAIRYFGTCELDTAGLPPYHLLTREERPTGYVAVSVRFLNLDYAKDGSFGWLRAVTPLEVIGKSIDLFYIPERVTAAGSRQGAADPSPVAPLQQGPRE